MYAFWILKFISSFQNFFLNLCVNEHLIKSGLSSVSRPGTAIIKNASGNQTEKRRNITSETAINPVNSVVIRESSLNAFDLETNAKYRQLLTRLEAAEQRAQKKGVGIWKRPTFSEKMIARKEEMVENVATSRPVMLFRQLKSKITSLFRRRGQRWRREKRWIFERCRKKSTPINPVCLMLIRISLVWMIESFSVHRRNITWLHWIFKEMFMLFITFSLMTSSVTFALRTNHNIEFGNFGQLDWIHFFPRFFASAIFRKTVDLGSF